MEALKRNFIKDKRRLRKIPPTEPYEVEKCGNFIFETFKVTEENREELRDRAIGFEDLLNYSRRRTTHEIEHNILPGGEVRFVKYRGLLGRILKRPYRDVGVVTQEVREAVVRGETKKAVIIGVKAIESAYQRGRKGIHIGTKLARDVILKYHPHYVIGKTRNVGVPETYKNTGFISKFRPLDELVDPEGQEVLSIILHPEELSTKTFRTNLETGLVTGVYPKADNKLFKPRDRKYMGIYKRMEEIGVLPAETGNGMRYLAEVDQETVDAEIARGCEADAVSVELLDVRPLSGAIGKIIQRIPISCSRK